MSQKSFAPTAKPPAEKLVRDIRRVTRKHHSTEDKIRIVLEGLRGKESIAALCHRRLPHLRGGGSLAGLRAGHRRLSERAFQQVRHRIVGGSDHQRGRLHRITRLQRGQQGAVAFDGARQAAGAEAQPEA